jgi:hypothetical protein
MLRATKTYVEEYVTTHWSMKQNKSMLRWLAVHTFVLLWRFDESKVLKTEKNA